MLEVLDSQTQHYEDTELSGGPARGDSLEKENTWRRADIQEPLAEGSNSQREASAAVKPTYRKAKSEENEVDQSKPMSLQERIKVYSSRVNQVFFRSKKIKQNNLDFIDNISNDSEFRHFKDAHRPNKKGKPKVRPSP